MVVKWKSQIRSHTDFKELEITISNEGKLILDLLGMIANL